uniref:Globin domain-containing protein n=1 Tax=Pyrodinium bahamense TaxID=73915 RepID=A0A7S0BB47_9DINO
MKDLGIPRGHAVKLRRHLRENQGPQASTQPVAKPSSAPRGAHRATSPAPNGTSGSNMPNDEMKTAVERSWERVQALGTFTVGELLYRHTFDLAPEVMDLFPPEVRLKYRDWTADEGIDESNVYESPALRKLFSKFVNAIGCTVAGLHDFSRLVPMLRQLGSRHINYGVREQYWPILGKALIYTLRECLRDSFTSEVEAAWTMVYGFMSNIMIEGLRSAIATRGGCVSAGSDMPALSQKNGGGIDDDCASEDSLTTGLPSECDICGSDPWNRQTSALTEDALQRQSSGHTDEVEDTKG